MCEQGEGEGQPARSRPLQPTLSDGVYFLLEMRLLQKNVDWSELKLVNNWKDKQTKQSPGLVKTFYSLRSHSPARTLLP